MVEPRIRLVATSPFPSLVDFITSTSGYNFRKGQCIAEREGRPIPPTWAVDKDGRPTTDAKAAIAGMMLPAGGAKGFGLALAIDLICSALDVGHLCADDGFRNETGAQLNRIRASRSLGGGIRTPGQRNVESRQGNTVQLRVPRLLTGALNNLARSLGLEQELGAAALRPAAS